MKWHCVYALTLAFMVLSPPAHALPELKIVDADTSITFELLPVSIPTAPLRPGKLFLGLAGAEQTWQLKSVIISTAPLPSSNLFLGLAAARLSLDMRSVEVKTERKSAIILFIGGAEATATMNLSVPHGR